MKTKNNIQNAVLKSLAVIASFIVISLTVSAQDLWQSFTENETVREIALDNIKRDSESQPTSTTAKELTDVNSLEALFKTESEKTMELEEWMTNDNFFKVEENPTKKKAIKTAIFVFEEMKDSKLEFEDWMFNPKYWSVR